MATRSSCGSVFRGVAKASGIELDVPFIQVWTMRDGLPVAMRLEIEGSC